MDVTMEDSTDVEGRELTDEEQEAERQAIAGRIVSGQRSVMFHSPAHYNRDEHLDEILDSCFDPGWADRMDAPDSYVASEHTRRVAHAVCTAAEVLAARRVHHSVQSGMGLSAFVCGNERLPIKKELRDKLESAFLLLSDALVAMNRGDLSFFELGQSEKCEVTRARNASEAFRDGTDPCECMSMLAECFDDMRTDRIDGIRPWDPTKILEWAQRASSSEKQIAYFLLNVWSPNNGNANYPWPPFRLFEFIRSASDRSKAVVRAWLSHPWLP